MNESTIANYAANDDKTMTAVKNFDSRMEVVEGVTKDVMKRVVDSGDLDHRLTSLEGTTDAVSQRVGGVETKISDLKRATGVEAEENQTKTMAALDKVKADLKEVVESLESSKKESGSKTDAVSASVEGLKRDVDLVKGKVGDVGTGLER